MADFDVNTITVQGAVAIASATAGDKLVIDGCDATTDVLTQAQAVQIATRPASPASTTDTIGLAGSTDNHVYAYASFIRGESTGGDVHSFLLYGHMESDATNVFVVAVASATAPTHIPTSSDVTNRVEIQFELTFSATDEVVTVTDTSMYTTRGEFLILKNRTVTTHAEGQATVGENQTIYGNKDFKNNVDFNSAYTVQASRTETQGGHDNTNTLIFSPKPSIGMGTHFVATTKDDGRNYKSSEATMSAGSLALVSGGAMFDASHSSSGSQASVVASGGMNQAVAGMEVKPSGVTLYKQAAGSITRSTLSFNGNAIYGSFDTITTNTSAKQLLLECVGNSVIQEYLDANNNDGAWHILLNNSLADTQTALTFYAGSDAGGQLICEPDARGVSKLGTSSIPWGEAHISVTHTGEVRYDNKVSVTAYNGNTGGDDYARLIVEGSTAEDPFVEFQLESNTIGQSTSYIFCLEYFAAPGKDLGYANGGGWNNIYANSSIHTPLIIGDQRELVLDAQGTGNGKTEIGMYCTDSSVSVSINLQANQESNVVYAFTRYSLSGPGKDLGYQNGGEWNNIYAKNLHGKLPTVDGNTEPEVGAIFFAGIEVSGAIANAAIGRTAKVGSPLVQGGSNITAIGAAIWDTQTGFSSYTPFSTTAGKYKLLCGATKTGSEAACFALVMRIE
jgi:hypothetical protein